MDDQGNPKDPDPRIWIKPDFWGKPKWADKDVPCIGTLEKIRRKLPFRNRIKYEEYFASQLRARYLDLEGDFRTIIAFYLHDSNKENELDNIYLIAFYMVDLLKTTKILLDKERLEKVDLLSGSCLLDQAEQCMIWIMPSNIKIAEIESLDLDLANLKKDIEKKKLDLNKETIEKLHSMLIGCKKELEMACKKPENTCIVKDQDDACNARIEGVIETLNKITLDDMINTGLQIERLRSLRYWGIVLLFLFILMFPMVSSTVKWDPYNVTVSHWNNVSYSFIKPWVPELVGLYVAASFCIIGGIGGFLSGLLQVRSTRTNLGQYEENVLLFQIRPIFGAFAALVTFMLMSWGTLSSIIAESEGAYVLTAFLSGFSERYFLRLLMTLSEESGTKPQGSETKTEEGGTKSQGSEAKTEEAKGNTEVSNGETPKKEGSP